jgi:hypothetical protein
MTMLFGRAHQLSIFSMAHDDSGHPRHDAHTLPIARDGHEQHTGYDKHAGHSIAMFRDKFWLTLVLTIPTLIWGHALDSIRVGNSRLSLWRSAIRAGCVQ